jgi:hypothetical protein
MIVENNDSIINNPTSKGLTKRRSMAYTTAMGKQFPVIAKLIDAVKQWIGKKYMVVHESIIHSLAGN